MTQEEEQALQLWRTMVRASRAVGRVVRETLQKHGLRRAQFGLLWVLAEAGPDGLKLSDISQKLVVTCGNITGLMDRLEEMGYVVREPHPSDRRVVLAKLTPQARTVLDEIVPIHTQRLLRIMSCLSAKDQDTLSQLLSRVSDQAALVDREPEDND